MICHILTLFLHLIITHFRHILYVPNAPSSPYPLSPLLPRTRGALLHTLSSATDSMWPLLSSSSHQMSTSLPPRFAL